MRSAHMNMTGIYSTFITARSDHHDPFVEVVENKPRDRTQTLAEDKLKVDVADRRGSHGVGQFFQRNLPTVPGAAGQD